jgi:hypothetical protein
LIGISFKKNSRVCVPEKMNFRVILQPADWIEFSTSPHSATYFVESV